MSAHVFMVGQFIFLWIQGSVPMAAVKGCVECLQLFQAQGASCQWIYHSGVWRMVAVFSDLH